MYDGNDSRPLVIFIMSQVFTFARRKFFAIFYFYLLPLFFFMFVSKKLILVRLTSTAVLSWSLQTTIYWAVFSFYFVPHHAPLKHSHVLATFGGLMVVVEASTASSYS